MPIRHPLPEMTRDQVIETARCLLGGKIPDRDRTNYRCSQLVAEGHFSPAPKRFILEKLAAHLVNTDLIKTDLKIRRGALEEAIREVLESLQNLHCTFNCSLSDSLLGAYWQELGWLLREWEELERLESDQGEYTPQSVTAARAIVRNEDVPEEVFLGDIFHGSSWENEWVNTFECLASPGSVVFNPNTDCPEHEQWIRDELEDLTNRSLSLNAIDEALREVFRLFKAHETRGYDMECRNINVYNRIKGALLDEMADLVDEWDRVIKQDRGCLSGGAVR